MQTKKKLTLSKETLRTLESPELMMAVGGGGLTGWLTVSIGICTNVYHLTETLIRDATQGDCGTVYSEQFCTTSA